MVDGVPIATLDGLGVVGIIVLFGLGLATGRLFTKRQYDDAIHDRDEWRAECRIKDAQLAERDTQSAEKDAQLRHLGEVGRTVDAIMRSIQRVRAGSDEE